MSGCLEGDPAEPGSRESGVLFALGLPYDPTQSAGPLTPSQLAHAWLLWFLVLPPVTVTRAQAAAPPPRSPASPADAAASPRRATARFMKRPPAPRWSRGQRWSPSSSLAVSLRLSPSTQHSIYSLELDSGAQLPGFIAPYAAHKQVIKLSVCLLCPL